jgi:hypothetical protein
MGMLFQKLVPPRLEISHKFMLDIPTLWDRLEAHKMLTELAASQDYSNWHKITSDTVYCLGIFLEINLGCYKYLH